MIRLPRFNDMIFLFFFPVFASQITSARVEVKSCEGTSDCSDGYYCNENICKKCLSCSFLFRKGKSCVVDFNECGGCLKGYEEILITDSSTVIKPCKPVIIFTKPVECLNDDNCPRSNYCYQSSCVKCFDCSLLNRFPPASGCAKQLNDCGSCVDGFIEVAVTTETNSKPCELNLNAIHSALFALPLYLAVITFICLCAVLIFITRVIHRRTSSKTLDQLEIEPSAPPLHVMCEPQNINLFHTEEVGQDFDTSDLDKLLEPKEGNEYFQLYVKDEKQKAKIFQMPHAPYYVFPQQEDLVDNISQNNEEDIVNNFSLNSEEDNHHRRDQPQAGVRFFIHQYNELRYDNESMNSNSSDQHPGEIDNPLSVSEVLDDSNEETETPSPEMSNLDEDENPAGSK